jgi:hypothetical protein
MYTEKLLQIKIRLGIARFRDKGHNSEQRNNVSINRRMA